MPNHDDMINVADPAYYMYRGSYTPPEPAVSSASVPLSDLSFGLTTVELLGPDELAITQYDSETDTENVVLLTRDMCLELLGVLKSALA